MKNPAISVIMSVYNGDRYLKACIDSILQQTFQDFEFIIVNDGSTDATATILDEYRRRDRRTHIIEQKNSGVGQAIARGLQLARGRYIARMDADDISLPSRFATQIIYLEKHQQVDILGSQAQLIDESGELIGITPLPVSSHMIKWTLHFFNCIFQPTVMIRRSLSERLALYNPKFAITEDYDLWIRASQVTEIVNLPWPLLQNRIWKESLRSTRKQELEKIATGLLQQLLSQTIGREIDYQSVENLRWLELRNYSAGDCQRLENGAKLICRIYHAFLFRHSLTRPQIIDITYEVVRKLLLLTNCARKISPQAASRIVDYLWLTNFALAVPKLWQRGWEKLIAINSGKQGERSLKFFL